MHYIQKVITEGPDTAQFTGYVIDNNHEMGSDRVRPAVLIFPGGGYEFISPREAEPVALKVLGMGYHAFILKYSVYPALYPTALRQAAQAILLIRHNAAAWHVDPDRIIVLGFSAGGHLAASLATMWSAPVLQDAASDPRLLRPSGLALAYSVLTAGQYTHQSSIDHLLGPEKHNPTLLHDVSPELHVTAETPPTFLWHTMADDLVPAENSLQFVQKLRSAGVPAELHLFPNGGHGLSLAADETRTPQGTEVDPQVAIWPTLFQNWVKENFSA